MTGPIRDFAGFINSEVALPREPGGKGANTQRGNGQPRTRGERATTHKGNGGGRPR
jgi:hypothetical protein